MSSGRIPEIVDDGRRTPAENRSLLRVARRGLALGVIRASLEIGTPLAAAYFVSERIIESYINLKPFAYLAGGFVSAVAVCKGYGNYLSGALRTIRENWNDINIYKSALEEAEDSE